MSHYRLFYPIFVAASALAACSNTNQASSGSLGATAVVVSSSRLADFYSQATSQLAAKASWTAMSRLSPSDFARALLSSTQADSVTMDGVTMTGARTKLQNSLAAFDNLSKSYSSMNDMIQANHLQINFQATAASLKQQFAHDRNFVNGTTGTALALQDTTQAAGSADTTGQGTAGQPGTTTVEVVDTTDAVDPKGATDPSDWGDNLTPAQISDLTSVDDPHNDPRCVGNANSIDAKITTWNNEPDAINSGKSFAEHERDYYNHKASTDYPEDMTAAALHANAWFAEKATLVDNCERGPAAQKHQKP